MGKVRALSACYALQEKYPRLKRILLVGYAGGLTGLKVGDLIEPDVFIEYDYDARPFERFPHILRRARGSKLFRHSRRAMMLTQDRFVTVDPLRGTALGKKYPVVACDMESYAVAHYSRQTGMPVSVLKYISDEADSQAPHDFLKACKDLAPKLIASVLEAINAL